MIKFGGTSLSDSARVRAAADCVSHLIEAGEQVVVVLSAQGDETNRLLASAYEVTGGEGDPQDIYRIALQGEENSVAQMCAALRSLKITAVPFTPRERETWPIVVDSDDQSPIAASKINEERSLTLRSQKTAQRFRTHVAPHLRVGAVPVIAGFFALGSNDQLVTLGRGGSDITAFIAGRYIGADEVIIVTDVEGVLSGDPSVAGDAQLLEEITAEEAVAMGSQVIHPRAIKFKTEEVKGRIINYKNLDRIHAGGTTILGSIQSSIYTNPRKLAQLTLVGEALNRQAGLLGEVSDRLSGAGIKVEALTAGERYIQVYLEDRESEEGYKVLHNLVAVHRDALKNLKINGALGEVRLRSSSFVDEPGVHSEITGILAAKRIKVAEIVTMLSDIYVYVAWDDLKEASEALSSLVETSPTLF